MRLSLPFTAISGKLLPVLILFFLTITITYGQDINNPGPQNIEYNGGAGTPYPYGNVYWDWNFNAYQRGQFASPTVNYTMPYQLLTPTNMDPSKKYPLFIMLHGAGEGIANGVTNCAPGTTANQAQNQCPLVWGGRILLDSQSRYPTYALFPNTGGGFWGNNLTRNEYEDPTTTAIQLIEYMIATKNIDPDRVYISGLSAGGMACWEFIERRPDLFASASAISGIGDSRFVNILADLKIWNFQGGDETKETNPIASSTKALYDQIVGQGGNIIRTSNLNRDHWAWVDAYTNSKWLKWVFGQNKKNIIVRYGGIPVICPGTTTALLGISQGFTSYQWQKDSGGGNFVNVTDNGTSNDYTASEVGTYRVQFMRNGVLENSNPVTITANNTVSPTPSVKASYTPILNASYKDVYLEGPVISSNNFVRYQWYKNDVPYKSDRTFIESATGKYTLRVQNVPNCPSLPSNPIYVVQENILPGLAAPSNLAVTNSQISSVSLQWQDNSSDEEAFYVEYSQGTWYYAGFVLANTTTFTVGNLNPGQPYYFRVRAIKLNGVSAFSQETSTTTLPDIIAPTASKNLLASNITDVSLSLQWNSATDNVKVTNYDIYQNNVFLTSTNDTSYSVTNLNPGTDYSYYVIAKDGSNNPAPKSNIANVKTAVLGAGVNFTYYVRAFTQLPDFSLFQSTNPPGFVSNGTNTPYMNNFLLKPGSPSDPAGLNLTGEALNNFAINYEGYINILINGTYTFYTTSDDGSKLFIDNKEVVNNDFTHGNVEKSGEIELAPGKHLIRVGYFEATGGNTLIVSWSGSSGTGVGSKTAIPDSRLFRIVSKPVSNSLPTALAGPDVTVSLPASTASLIGNGTDADGLIASYLWSYLPLTGQTAPTTSSLSDKTLNVSGLSQIGIYKFVLQVTDNKGGIGTDTVNVIVKNANPKPIVTLFYNGVSTTQASLQSPASTIALTGTITDPPSNIFTYEWIKISGPASFTPTGTNTLNPTFSNLVVGSYVIALKATDDGGEISADTITVVVQSSLVSIANLKLVDVAAGAVSSGPLSDGYLVDEGTFAGGYTITATTSPAQVTSVEWYIDSVKVKTNSGTDGPPYLITSTLVQGEYIPETNLVLSPGNHIIKAIPFINANQGDPYQITLNIISGPFRWDGGGSNTNWTTAANWDRDAVPTATDKVRLDNSKKSGSYTVVFNPGATPVASIEILPSSGATIIFNTNAPTITDGTGTDLTISAGGKLNLLSELTIGGNIVINQGTIDSKNSDLTILGTSSGTGTSIVNSGNGTSTVEFKGNGNDVIFSGAYENLVISGTGNKVLAGPVTVTDTIGLKTGTLVSNGNLTLDFVRGGISPYGTGTIDGIIHTTRPITPGWHYLSSPIEGSSYGDFNNTNPLWYGNFSVYQENNPSQDIDAGWVGAYNYDNSTLLSGNKYPGGPSELTGFAVYYPNQAPLNFAGTYIHSLASSYTASGLSYTPSGKPSSDGWHLVGNPYPSYIDFTKTISVNVSPSITFYDPARGQNIVYTPGNETFPPTEINGATQYVGPMQAFWIQATADNASLTIPNKARTVKPAFPTGQEAPVYKPFYRVSEGKPYSLRLAIIADGSSLSDETIVRFSDVTTEGFDQANDVYKFINDNNLSPSLYTVLNDDNYAINSLPLAFTQVTIPLSVEVPSSGTYKIKLKDFGAFDPSSSVILYDKLLNKSQNLMEKAEYEFSIDRSEAHNRFNLNVSNSVTANSASAISHFYVNQNGNDATLVFENMGDDEASVYVTNSLGQQLFSAEHVNIASGSYPLHFGKGDHGVYIIQVVTPQRKLSRKIILK